jgi:hypothetical protein
MSTPGSYAESRAAALEQARRPLDAESRWFALLAEGEVALREGRLRDARDVALQTAHEALQRFARSADEDEKRRLRVLIDAANALQRRARG